VAVAADVSSDMSRGLGGYDVSEPGSDEEPVIQLPESEGRAGGTGWGFGTLMKMGSVFALRRRKNWQGNYRKLKRVAFKLIH
jgi:hypothetical protein